MKIVINTCYGGFSLSPAAVRRLAELNGRECYFFKHDFKGPYTPISEQEASKDRFNWVAFDIPNPDEVIGESFRDEDGLFTTFNGLYNQHDLTSRPEDRTDPKLIQVVEELGGKHREGASGSCAELAIVEIPDGVDWEIDEYDGNETVEEKHRSWR